MLIGIAVLAGIGLLATLSAGRRHARRSLDGVRQVTRVGGAALRTLGITAAIVAAQWLVAARFADNTTVLLTVLVIPALFAGASIARLLTVTEVAHPAGGRGGGHR
ncbi:MAG: hypothetical protein GEU86_12905 [Actinophytocola sp.]|nr:hypothetical protein [Actinophytocola sp.]